MSQKVMNFALPSDLHFQLKTMSLIKSCSMAAVIRNLIREGVEEFLDNYEGTLSPEADKYLMKIHRTYRKYYTRVAPRRL